MIPVARCISWIQETAGLCWPLSAVDGVTGASGADLGQFSGPVNISVGKRGVYVADTGNDRIQSLTFSPMAFIASRRPTSDSQSPPISANHLPLPPWTT